LPIVKWRHPGLKSPIVNISPTDLPFHYKGMSSFLQPDFSPGRSGVKGDGDIPRRNRGSEESGGWMGKADLPHILDREEGGGELSYFLCKLLIPHDYNLPAQLKPFADVLPLLLAQFFQSVARLSAPRQYRLSSRAAYPQLPRPRARGGRESPWREVSAEGVPPGRCRLAHCGRRLFFFLGKIGLTTMFHLLSRRNI